MMKSWMLVALVAVAGCSVRANYHSKTGRSYAQITPRAVICDDEEAKRVMQTGHVIGTIDANGEATATVVDMNEKAAKVAAEEGGTHLIITRASTETWTRHHPATSSESCQRTEHGHDCTTTYYEARDTSYETPVGDYIVVRVEPRAWQELPPELQPMP